MIVIRKLAVLLVILLGIIIFLISPIGLNTTLYLATYLIPGKLTYQHASGNLTKSFILSNFEYKRGAVDIKGAYLYIAWHPRQLIHHRLFIKEIKSRRLQINIDQTAKTNTKTTDVEKAKEHKTNDTPAKINFAPIDFSWGLVINKGELSDITLKYDTHRQPTHLSSIKLHGQLNRDKTNLQLQINKDVSDNIGLHASVKGSVQDYMLTIDYKNSLKKQYYILKASGDQTHITIQANTPLHQPNIPIIQADGVIRWQNTLVWRGVLQVEKSPLSIPQLYPLDKTNFTLHTEGQFDGTTVNQTTQLSNMILWLINGTELNGDIILTQKNGQASSLLKLQNATDSLNVDVTFNHTLRLKWQFNIGELSDLFMSLNGSLKSHGFIVKSDQGSNIQANTQLSAFNLGDLDVDNISINIAGTLNKHTINTTGSVQQAKFSSRIIGKIQNSPLAWSGSLNELNIHSDILGHFRLQKATSLYFSKEKIQVNTLNLLSEKGRFFFNVLWTGIQKSLKGQLKFDMSALSIPTLNITLKPLKVNASAGGKSLKFSMSASSNSSPIKLQGSADWKNHLQLKSTLLGDNVLVMNTSSYKVYASPDLALTVDKNHRIDLKGKINIPQASITPDSFISVVSLPNDVEYVGVAKEKKSSFWQFYTNFNTTLGKAINVNAQGIHGKLQGTLNVSKSPDQPFLGSGKLSLVNGYYYLFGSKLTLNKGDIIFIHSPLSNPNLDIQASRTFTTSLSSSSFGITRLKVGANITGSLKRPQVSLFSQPAVLSDVDILSYLLFGSGTSSRAKASTASNTFILLQIANSLKSGRSTGTDHNVIQKLQHRLGFTEFGVQTQMDIDAIGNVTGQSEQVVAGRYLSPKLYVRYKYDLFYEENILEAQYLLSHHWILQTNASSSDNGADILYTIESGKPSS